MHDPTSAGRTRLRIRPARRSLIGIFAFGGVFKNFPRVGVDTDLMSDRAFFDVEGKAHTGATFFFFELFVGDCSGKCLQCEDARSGDIDLNVFSQPSPV